MKTIEMLRLELKNIRLSINENHSKIENTEKSLSSLDVEENETAFKSVNDNLMAYKKTKSDLILEENKISNEIARVEKEIAINEINEKHQKELAKAKEESLKIIKSKDLKVKEIKKENSNLKYSFKVKNTTSQKLEEKRIEFKNVDEEFTPLDHTIEFLKSFISFDARANYNAKIMNRIKKDANVLVVNENAAPTSTFAQGPGYKLGTGEVAEQVSETPVLITEIILEKLYATSGVAYLTGGFKEESVNSVRKFLSLDGFDFTAENAEKETLTHAQREITKKFSKIAGMLIYSEESLRRSDVLNFILGEFTNIAAAGIMKKIDKSLLNNLDTAGFPGLLSAERNGRDFLPVTRVDYKDIFTIMDQANAGDPDFAVETTKIIVNEDIRKDLTDTYRTGGLKTYEVTEKGNVLNVNGNDVVVKRAMFEDYHTNRVVGIVVDGNGLEAYTEMASGQTSPIIIKSDGGISNFSRNMYKLVAETFIDVVVTDTSKVRVLVDNASFLGTVKGGTTAANITFTIADGYNTLGKDGEKFTLKDENNVIINTGAIAGGAGEIAFTGLDSKYAGKIVKLFNANGKVVSTGRMGV